MGVPAASVIVHETDPAIADCALRLLRLLDRAEAAGLLYPLILRELHVWLLAGRHGQAVRSLAAPGTAAQRIAVAVALLRGAFDQPLRVDTLAAAAGMSASTFHHHFRAITSLSPLQFQKQLRLIEARRLMRGKGRSASSAAFAVGYESVSQFTREYARLFGLPPARDAEAARLSAEAQT